MSTSHGQQLITMTHLGPHLVMVSAVTASRSFVCSLNYHRSPTESYSCLKVYVSCREWRQKSFTFVFSLTLYQRELGEHVLLRWDRKGFYRLLCGLTWDSWDQASVLEDLLVMASLARVLLFLSWPTREYPGWLQRPLKTRNRNEVTYSQQAICIWAIIKV